MTRATLACSSCAARDNKRFFVAKEMMFGTREQFTYMECSACGCLELLDPPLDPSRFYPDDYYPSANFGLEANAVSRLLQHQRARYCLERSGIVGRLAYLSFGQPRAGIFGEPDYYTWLRRCGVGFGSRILDVGCGGGTLLARLRRDGFTNLTGVDPFISREIVIPGLRILKAEMDSIQDTFELVMLHHTFEHMNEPVRVMQRLRALLKPAGTLLIRVPIAGSYAFKRYGSNWAQLDAPRHLFIQTPRSMSVLARLAGLSLVKTEFDSTAFQIWASEQYEQNIPLRDERSFAMNPEASMFLPRHIESYERTAAELNLRGEGDSACFYLQREE